ncbi:MAG: hypothetical protein ABEJ79_03540 [Halolamina sp.]
MNVVVVDAAGAGRSDRSADADGVADDAAAADVDVVDTVTGRDALTAAVDANEAGENGSAPGVDAFVAVGPAALRTCALADPDRPVVPVGVGADHHAAPRRRVTGALTAVRDGDARLRSRPLLSLTVGGDRVGRAVLDATLMTDRPAKISEYRVAADGEPLTAVRADGVVVATPLGSGTYARANGGPMVAHGGGLSVVPVAPFATRSTPWVGPGPVTVTVERDETAVALFADHERVAVVGVGDSVTISPTGTLSTYHVPDAVGD